MDLPQIFSMRLLIFSWPWALLGFKSEIILAMFPLVNSILDNSREVKWIRSERSLLPLPIIDHSFAKNDCHFFLEISQKCVIMEQ